VIALFSSCYYTVFLICYIKLLALILLLFFIRQEGSKQRKEQKKTEKQTKNYTLSYESLKHDNIA